MTLTREEAIEYRAKIEELYQELTWGAARHEILAFARHLLVRLDMGERLEAVETQHLVELLVRVDREARALSWEEVEAGRPRETLEERMWDLLTGVEADFWRRLRATFPEATAREQAPPWPAGAKPGVHAGARLWEAAEAMAKVWLAEYGEKKKESGEDGVVKAESNKPDSV